MPPQRLVWFYYTTRHLLAAKCTHESEFEEPSGGWGDGSRGLASPFSSGSSSRVLCSSCNTKQRRGVRCISVTCGSWICADCCEASAGRSTFLWKYVARNPYWLCKRCLRPTPGYLGNEIRRASLRALWDSDIDASLAHELPPAMVMRLLPAASVAYQPKNASDSEDSGGESEGGDHDESEATPRNGMGCVFGPCSHAAPAPRRSPGGVGLCGCLVCVCVCVCVCVYPVRLAVCLQAGRRP